MGPLAGIGDSFFWGTFRLIACGVGAPMAAEGNILGVILYLILNLVPSTLTRWYGFNLGYKGGRQFLSRIQADGTLSKLTESARVLAMVVIGGMVYGTLMTLVVVPCIYDMFMREKKEPDRVLCTEENK